MRHHDGNMYMSKAFIINRGVHKIPNYSLTPQPNYHSYLEEIGVGLDVKGSKLILTVP